jgi:hypothetical protein
MFHVKSTIDNTLIFHILENTRLWNNTKFTYCFTYYTYLKPRTVFHVQQILLCYYVTIYVLERDSCHLAHLSLVGDSHLCCVFVFRVTFPTRHHNTIRDPVQKPHIFRRTVVLRTSYSVNFDKGHDRLE